MDKTYNKHEKLKSKKLIDQLFTEGKSVSVYPFRMVYLETIFEDHVPFKTGVSVSKKYFKKAVDRNRIKRLMREAYRLNKTTYFNNITTPYAFMILYIGNTKPTYNHVEQSMNKLFKKFTNVTPKQTIDEKTT
ncbi:ribonuclease P protein component [Bizionia myxarmorum]|uniref:Ribonuclease P protein component n=1 Tax=Bizionia myxarmorum TaxID=291186 RepID=A0A5D0RCQ1_9FLAO|nr:ribonuclease P protein component [Bizionia myxarmorum]TYB78706.1 ribonuclease P protein component [Bizionia myxarmorum]